jgi:hypothetical protein
MDCQGQYPRLKRIVVTQKDQWKIINTTEGIAMNPVDRRRFLQLSTALGGSAMLSSSLLAQPPSGDISEPVYRVSRIDNLSREAVHPLDPAINIAHETLSYVRENIHDYTAILIRRERIGNTLGDHEFMGIKVRNRKMVNGLIKTPFSIYVTFLKPADMKGREVIYVENQNKGNIVVHEGGFRGKFIPTVELDPNGMLAMRGQRYPITDAGIENLCIKLIEKGERDRQHGECVVEQKSVKLGDRPGTLISVVHPVPRPHFDFYRAEIFIDEEMGIPTRFASYQWPRSTGGEPELLEEYTYQNIKLNVGLTDLDFDRKNPKYNF